MQRRRTMHSIYIRLWKTSSRPPSAPPRNRKGLPRSPRVSFPRLKQMSSQTAYSLSIVEASERPEIGRFHWWLQFAESPRITNDPPNLRIRLRPPSLGNATKMPRGSLVYPISNSLAMKCSLIRTVSPIVSCASSHGPRNDASATGMLSGRSGRCLFVPIFGVNDSSSSRSVRYSLRNVSLSSISLR